MNIKALNNKEQKIVEKLVLKGILLKKENGDLIQLDFVGLKPEEKKLLFKILR